MNEQRPDPRALLAALGHASRYRIALCLIERERCVSELAIAIGLSQSCTTRHVQALERAGLARSRREGKRVVVGIERDGLRVAALLAWLAPEGPPASAPSPGYGDPAGAHAGGTARAQRLPGRAEARPRQAGPRTSGTPAPPLAPTPAREELPPAEGATSGTNAAPPPAPPSRPRRTPDTLEDFLL